MPTSTKKPKCLIFIDHNITVRHFILSGAFKEIEKKYSVTYVFNEDHTTEKKWLTVDPHTLSLERVLTTHIPRERMGSWYPLYAISVLNSQRGTNNYRHRKNLMTTINGTLRTYWYELQSLPVIFPIIRKIRMKQQGVWTQLEELINEECPDVVIHPSLLTGYHINELLPICKKIGIPSVVLMNSWDNPSQKAITTAVPSLLAVWGKQTFEHAVEYMGMPKNKIEILGAAQFDLYREPVKEKESELRAMFQVPSGKPILLFGGVSKSINETKHLKLLDEAIINGKISDCHIIYRPHPWRGGLLDGEQNFFDIDFKNVTMDPFMKQYYCRVLDKPDDSFDIADYEVVRKLLHLVRGTISSMSTIQLETALFGKPSISYLNETDFEKQFGKSIRITERLAHFKGLWECPGIQFCRSDAELPAAVNELLSISNDEEFCSRIKAYARTEYVSLKVSSYAENLLSSVERLRLSKGSFV